MGVRSRAMANSSNARASGGRTGRRRTRSAGSARTASRSASASASASASTAKKSSRSKSRSKSRAKKKKEAIVKAQKAKRKAKQKPSRPPPRAMTCKDGTCSLATMKQAVKDGRMISNSEQLIRKTIGGSVAASSFALFYFNLIGYGLFTLATAAGCVVFSMGARSQ